jgi:hypothetical protein
MSITRKVGLCSLALLASVAAELTGAGREAPQLAEGSVVCVPGLAVTADDASQVPAQKSIGQTASPNKNFASLPTISVESALLESGRDWPEHQVDLLGAAWRIETKAALSKVKSSFRP